MFSIFQNTYDCVERSQFENDLRAKDYAILLRDESHSLQGFTSISVLSAHYGGKLIKAIYSGDTVVTPACRGSLLLAQTWIKLAGAVQAQYPQHELYWFLIVKGEKTYRFLPYYLHEYYPHWQQETPAPMQEIMYTLAREKFGSAYDARTGLLKFPHSMGQLSEEEAKVDFHKEKKPEVAFFLQKNPEYYKGNELVCLARLSCENLRTWGKRPFTEGYLGNLKIENSSYEEKEFSIA